MVKLGKNCNNEPMKIMKFGGSSLANAQRIEAVFDIIKKESAENKIGVVLSAMKGVTDLLINAAKLAETANQKYRNDIEELETLQTETVRTLLGNEGTKTEKKLLSLIGELRMVLTGIELVRECSSRSLDLVASFGERLNCTLFSDYLNSKGIEAWMLDTREAIITDNRYGSASVKFVPSYNNLQKLIAANTGIPIITGFIARSSDGSTTTLGRNGSDFTASIVGAATESDTVEIWTDVDGVMSADPRLVDEAFVIPELNVQEAMELSYFGAEVIHPSTMTPAVENNIPIYIKNTLNPSVPGTKIAKDTQPHDRAITGIASIPDTALINVEGDGMLGVPGIASRVFMALAKADVNVIMISQASSEHSICIVFRSNEAKKALKVLEDELRPEIETKKIQSFDHRENLEIVAIIGENMRGTPGISGKLFSSLGKAGVNILAIAQGSSERNISFVIEDKDKTTALRTIHHAFLGEKK